MIEKYIENTMSSKFVINIKTEVDFLKGFTALQNRKFENDWFRIYNNKCALPVPTAVKIAQSTQRILQKAVLPTGKRYN